MICYIEVPFKAGWTVYVFRFLTSLTRPVFIQVIVSSKESEMSCICVTGLSFLPLSTISRVDFETVPTVWYYFFYFSFY